jgi:hypothetical protein
MQPHSSLVHLPHAVLNLTLPEQRTILLQPERDLTQLTVEHLQAGTSFLLKHGDRSGEPPQGICGIDVG